MEISRLLKEITADDYKKVSENVRELSKKLINGEYMQQALDKSTGLINDEN